MRATARMLTAVAAVAALLALPSGVLGHVELVSTTPASGDNLDAAPTEVTVTFDDELDPDLSSFTVTDVDGNVVGDGGVDLTVPDRNVLVGDVTIIDPGIYTVSYTVAGIDGHAIDGTFSFGYNADEEIPEPTGGDDENPDTALPRGPLPILAILGGLLLGAGGLLGFRRLAAQ
jgi:methionine-rich copper-binding protein CopC